MNRNDLIEKMAEETGLTKKNADSALKAMLAIISEQLKQGDKIQLPGFGTFEVTEREARIGRNPATNETVEIPAAKVPKFKAGKALKRSLNE